MRIRPNLARSLAVICVGGLAAGVPPALAAFPGKNGKIAFASDRDGSGDDIWTMNPDGSHLVNITAGAGGVGASWRADGRKLVFQTRRTTPTNPEGDVEIYVMNANGSHRTQITIQRPGRPIPGVGPGRADRVHTRP